MDFAADEFLVTTGDLLWMVAELDDVTPFVSEAARHLSSHDKGAAAYAMEIVLRGSQDPDQLGAALERLRSCDVVVCEHTVRTLAGEGLARVVEVLGTASGAWATLAKGLSCSPLRREVIEGLVSDASRDRQVVGLVLVTLAREQHAGFSDCLARSTETWVRDYGEWLER